MSDRKTIELIKERDRLFIKSQHLGQDKERLEKSNAALSDKLSDYQQDMAVLAGENEVLIANMDEMLYDLLESNPIMSVYWRKKTLHLRVKEGGEV